MATGTLQPERAAVRPRVLVGDDATAQRLDEFVAELLAAGRPSVVHLLGPDGSGKSTALRHLAACFPDEPRLVLLDEGEGLTAGDALSSGPRTIVIASRAPLDLRVVRCRPAPWDDDDCLEYLAGTNRATAANAFARWCAVAPPQDLRSRPALGRAVLDVLAMREDVPDAFRAIDVALATRFGAGHLGRIRHLALLRLLRGSREMPTYGNDAIEPWLASSAIREHLAAGFLLDAIEGEAVFDPRRLPIGPALLGAATRVLRGDPERLARFESRTAQLDPEHVAWWLSILVAIRPGFRPPLAELRDLDGAVIPGIDLSGRRLFGSFDRCVLRRACLRGADLGSADLRKASLDGADLSECVAIGARHARLDLRSVRLDGACFDDVDLRLANLAGLTIRALRAQRANFADADLSATRCQGADLRGARFTGARLAMFDAEDADLRDADLRRATFHMGSSRSGLVPSDLASEGSRTGFYTDESLEDSFQAPEDVRKANLRGADLRGAKLDDTDFYLVDLRGARLDPEQLEWVKRCKAIVDRSA
ncbi:MAG: pentapeptide repeat-containing protein [Planctomycetes bacterium]|nr:pentapeptide repeat-containing protein [Planctomycetota bacterium]